jgi:sulfate transport system permease protein
MTVSLPKNIYSRRSQKNFFQLSDRSILISIALFYIFLILLIPAISVFYEAFHKGIEPFLEAASKREFIHAVTLTLTDVAIAVPLNVIFGLCAAWIIARNQFRSLYLRSRCNRFRRARS